jgi:hypothetical protein
MAVSLKAKYVYIADLHHEEQLWRNELNFYKEELTILENRLNQASAKTSVPAHQAGVESFQNRIDLQRDHISAIKHRIKRHQAFIAEYAQNHPIAIDHVHFTDHTKLREDMENFRKLYLEMKKGFIHQWSVIVHEG